MKEVFIKPWEWSVQNLITDIKCPYCGEVRIYSSSKFNFDSFTYYCKSCDKPFEVHSLDDGRPRYITINEHNEVVTQSSKVNKLIDQSTVNNPNYVNLVTPEGRQKIKERLEEVEKERETIKDIFKPSF